MKSGISLYNPTVLRRDVTRFAPVWGLYLAVLLLQLLITVTGNPARTANELLNTMEWGSILLLLYAPVCAGTLFGDLYNHGLCTGLHAMPLRREQWFFTHLLAGLLFFLLPALVFCGVMLLFTGAYGYVVAMWLAVHLLEFLFFFGAAVFSAQCAGNRLGMMVVYSFLNFSGLLIPGFAKLVIEPQLYGMEFMLTGFAPFVPSVKLEDVRFVDFVYHYESKTAVLEGVVPGDWLYLMLLAGIGLALTLWALRLYRRRGLEAAGQLLAVRWLSPVFPLVLALSAGLLLSSLGEEGSYGMLFLGLCAGFLVGHMLLRRTVRIFQGKRFLQLGILLAGVSLVLLAAKVDLFGIVRWIPPAERVRQVEVDPYSAWTGAVTLQDPEDIRTVLDLHAHALADRPEQGDTTEQVTLKYTLTNGATVTRRYRIHCRVDTDGDGVADSENPHVEALEKIFSRWQVVFHTEDWGQFQKRVTGICVDDVYLPREAHRQLLEAMYADCIAGTMSLNFRSGIRCYRVELQVTPLVQGNPLQQMTLFVYEDSVNTLKCVAELVAAYPEQLSKVDVYPEFVTGGA